MKRRNCHLLEIVKDHIDVIMKLVDKEVDITTNVTKCLDTALVATAVYLGKEAKRIRDQCDVNRIVALRKRILNRVKEPYLMEVQMVEMFLKELLSARHQNTRCIYYIMINHCDGSAPPGVSSPATKMFTGHVFVIERKPGAQYYVYQSYMDHYSLPQFYEKNAGSFSISASDLETFFRSLQAFYRHGVWTAEWNQTWLKFTHADESDLINYRFQNLIHFCYRMLPTETCTQSLRQLLINGKKSLPDHAPEFETILQKLPTA
jgi:hypothetical protein